jgi:hypothetical protein
MRISRKCKGRSASAVAALMQQAMILEQSPESSAKIAALRGE